MPELASPKTPLTIVAKECRFAVHVKSNIEGDNSDIHFIKERLTMSDGSTRPNVKIVENYKRPYWVTKKGFQNHNSKKEWEDIDKVDEFQCTQATMGESVARAMGKSWGRFNVKQLADSPYLYGVDLPASAFIKQSYRKKWDVVTPYSNGVFDTETDVLYKTNTIIMATISFKDKCFTAVRKDFLKGYSDPIPRIAAISRARFGDVLDKRNCTPEVIIADTEIDIVRATMAKAHEWGPDFLSVWNIEFDMDKVIAACDRAGVDPASIMSDPRVPDKYKYFKFKKGAAKRTTSSGVTQSFKSSQRWHTVFCPSSFYWVCAQAGYRQVRTGAPEETSYSLDHILSLKTKRSKLKFEQAGDLGGLDWHIFMQKNHPLEYVAYNQADCIEMELLDEETLDLQLSMPMFAEASDFQSFNSQPRRAADRLHFYVYEEHKKVMGSTSMNMREAFDDETIPVKGLIVMLPAHHVADNGLRVIAENPSMRTNHRAHVADLDVEGSYTNGEVVFNISKETTKREIISMEGISKEDMRMQCINYSGGRVNAVEFCVTMYGLPTLSTLLADFNAHLAQRDQTAIAEPVYESAY